MQIMRQRINEVRQAIDPNTHTMSGQDYQGLTQSGSALDNLTSADNPGVANIGRSVLDATRDAFERSLSPGDAATHQALRYRWRLMNAVEPLVHDAQGQSIDMGGLAKSISDQSRHFDLGGRGMAYTGGGQLGDYMSQARLIAEGPKPQGGGPLAGPLLTAQGATAMFGPHPVGARPDASVRDRETYRPLTRSDYRTNQIFDAAASPTAGPRRAMGLRAMASVP